ncbi:hypothetical protein NEL60_23275 [Escherichia coli]|uniref:hypothetical protein n=1 Tax=Escherichia coli TaxID=562 RepID=UPI00202165F0|nr:hypothetical protein [Escherichia coli]MDI1014436.1 hypothetical protein [Escherichia coli]
MKCNDYQSIKKELREYVNKIRVNTNYFRSDFIAEWALLTTIACWGAPEGGGKVYIIYDNPCFLFFKNIYTKKKTYNA